MISNYGKVVIYRPGLAATLSSSPYPIGVHVCNSKSLENLVSVVGLWYGRSSKGGADRR